MNGCGGSTQVGPPQTTPVGSIFINNPNQSGSGNVLLEQGLHLNLATTIKSTQGQPLNYQVAWLSSNPNVATVDINGRVTAVDTVNNGVTAITATSLNVTSQPLIVQVFQLVKKIDTTRFTPLPANSPGAKPDSLRAVVTNPIGGPVVGRKVVFNVTAGGGTLSLDTALTNAQGIAATQLTLGPAVGLNTVTATVLNAENVPTPYVNPNSVSYSIRTFDVLQAVAGNNQSGLLLSKLPVNPSVKLLDTLGKPRPGIPVKFTVGSGGRITTSLVSTGADGVASPGSWTLGDTPGEQLLIATVDNAKLILKATGTGTPLYFTGQAITAGLNISCGVNDDSTVSCWGEQPKVGDSTATNKSVPTLTKGGIKFSSVAANPDQAFGHVCGVGIDKSVYCWGLFSFPDTTTGTKVLSALVPTRYPTDLTFTQVAPGAQHNCALGVDQNIYCWGGNGVGQLGDQTLLGHLTPAAVTGGFKFQAVTSGSAHACGLAADGSAYCWGGNASGQLGTGNTIAVSSPTAVAGNIVFAKISAGQFFTCGITPAGATYCWGGIQVGAPPQLSPKLYTGAPLLTSIAAGGLHACGLTADGSAYCWGDNTVGQLGDSTTTSRINPTAVATSVKFKSISAGYGHTCAVTVSSSVMCWGYNSSGEQGDSTMAVGTFRTQPRYIVLGVTPPASGSLQASRAKR